LIGQHIFSSLRTGVLNQDPVPVPPSVPAAKKGSALLGKCADTDYSCLFLLMKPQNHSNIQPLQQRVKRKMINLAWMNGGPVCIGVSQIINMHCEN
jgi:hypothetical protein